MSTNLMIVGVGGQGTLLASKVLGQVLLDSGLEVKISEVHGMSQRGGSVNTDIRYGERVLSPMVPDGEADLLVTMDVTQIDNNRYRLGPAGKLLSSECLKEFEHGPARGATVAMLGVLSAHLELPEEAWGEAIRAALPERHHAMNLAAFAAGRAFATARMKDRGCPEGY